MSRPSILVDVGALSCGCTDHALETMAKAISGEGGEGPDIWAKHESPFVQSLIELFSSRGLMRLEKVKTELEAWLAGKKHKPGQAAAKPQAPGLTWTPAEMELVKVYLENLPPEQFGLSDWSLLVDYLAHRYLPAEALNSEAQWLSVRSTMMGKIQAAITENITVHAADALLGALPLTLDNAKETFRPSQAISSIMEYGQLRCTDQVTGLAESVRHRLKKVILAHQEKVLNGDAPPKETLQTQLFDEFSALNRDWRRIAVTEAGENANAGLIASLPPGTRVKRMEQYRGACPFCKKIHGRVLTVVEPAKKAKDGELEVWVGKTNIGRSASPKKREGDGLVERGPHERWWIPAGTVHPHCRGTWQVLEGAKVGDDPSFQAWLDKHLHQHKIGDDAS